MEYARLCLIEQALREQFYVATCDWNKRGWPRNREKRLKKLEALAEKAWVDARAAAPQGYEGPFTRGVDPDPR